MPAAAKPSAALMALALTLCACSHAERQVWENTFKTDVEDAFVTDDAFGCVRALTQVGRAYYTNVNGHLDATLAVARNPAGGTYPVGTLVTLQPAEAMVKRAPGFSPETQDWEFFKLEVVDGKTVIVERGTTGLKNIAGGCAECHMPAAKTYDMVCASGHGCEELPGIALKLAERALERDERCGG